MVHSASFFNELLSGAKLIFWLKRIRANLKKIVDTDLPQLPNVFMNGLRARNVIKARVRKKVLF